MAVGVWFLGTWFDLVSFALPVNIGASKAPESLPSDFWALRQHWV